jgi:hypothetical protein
MFKPVPPLAIAGLVLGAALCLTALPAAATGSAASSASESVGLSIGSLSGSVQRSSESSSRTAALAAGDYRIVEVVAMAEKPGTARLTLVAPADPANGGDDADSFYLYLPQAALDGSRVEAGQTVSVRQRDYGFELVGGPGREAFFLLLADDWYRELKSERVAL